jgi:hypothetical protein
MRSIWDGTQVRLAGADRHSVSEIVWLEKSQQGAIGYGSGYGTYRSTAIVRG